MKWLDRICEIFDFVRDEEQGPLIWGEYWIDFIILPIFLLILFILSPFARIYEVVVILMRMGKE